jgi:hypothetical protein
MAKHWQARAARALNEASAMALQAQVQDPACVRMGFMDGNEPHARAGFYWPRRKRAASLWSCGCMWAGKVWEGARAHARVGAATRPHPLLRRRLDRRRTWGAERAHWDSAHPCDICARSRTTAATSAPGLGSPLPHLRRDWAHPCHICTGTGLAPATSAPGVGPRLPHLHGSFARAAGHFGMPRVLGGGCGGLQRPRYCAAF